MIIEIKVIIKSIKVSKVIISMDKCTTWLKLMMEGDIPEEARPTNRVAT